MTKICLREKLSESRSSLLFAFSVFWFALRVVPKPSRIMYPCQRTTLTLIFAKIGTGIGVTCLTLTKFAKQKLLRLLVMGVLLTQLCLPFVLGGYQSVRYWIISQDRIRYGVSNNKVIRVHSDDATNWDFTTGYYWEYVNQSVVNRMVMEGVGTFIGVSDPQTAWRTILSNYTSGDIVGIKINGNDFWNIRLDEINTIPEVINAIINGVKSVGVPESDIWVIEPSDGRNRYFYQYYYDSINGLYPDVSLLDNDDVSFGSYSELRVSFPYASDHYITDQMYEVDHLIMVPIMKAITPNWGVTGAIKMMQGNIQSPGDFHGHLARTSADNPNVLMYQNPHIIGKVRLIVGDGLFGAWTGIHFAGGWGGTDTLVSPNQRSDVPNRWITFGNGAPNALFFGVDPVAIDCVMHDHLIAERNVQDQVDGQSMAPFEEPQLIAGAAAGLGILEHAPYSDIDYVEIELEEPTRYELTITTTVGGTTDPSPGVYMYPEDSIVQVTAIQEASYFFDHWELDSLDVGSLNPTGVTMDTNHSLHAVFLQSPTDTTPPAISLLSPENKTYPADDVPLIFILNESTSWIGYSLDGQANTTITGNTSLPRLADGSHYATVYANDTAGNMGFSGTVHFVVDGTFPNITDVSQIPAENNVLPENEVEVNATVADALSGVKQAILNYTNGNGTWIIVSMENLLGDIWNATIPAFPYCTNISYCISVEDNVGNNITTEEMGYKYQYHVIPEFSVSIILPMFMLATLLVATLHKKKNS